MKFRSVLASTQRWRLTVATSLLFGYALKGEDVSPYKLEHSGPHHQEFVIRDESARVVHRYVGLETGMNRWSGEEGRYVPAVAEFEIVEGVAVARKTEHTAIFQADVNSMAGTFEIFLPNNAGVIRGQCIGIAFTEKTTGNSVFLGELRSSIGEIVGSDEIIYQNAFDELKADVRYRLTKSGIAQDVIIREQLPSPTTFGFNPDDTLVEVWTEFLDAPASTKMPLLGREGAKDEDCVIDFGSMQIGAGRAFLLKDEQALEQLGVPMIRDIPVSKGFERIDGMRFLVEAVPYKDIAVNLEEMPAQEAQVRVDTDSLQGMFAVQEGTPKALPVSYFTKKSRKEMASATFREKADTVSLAASGYVIDFNLSASVTNFIFQSDTTYYASGPVNLNGNTTFEGGTIVKFAPTNNAKLAVVAGGTVKFPTNQWRPVIFTAKDDNAVGATISGSTGNPSGYYANPAISYSGGGIAAAKFTCLRISHAKIGLDISGVATGSANQIVTHAQFVNSETALKSSSTYLAVRNALFYNVTTNMFLVSSTNRAEHLTANKANTFFHNGGTSTLFLTNSLVIGVSNFGTFAGLSNITTGTEASVFQEIGAGKHYLSSGSILRNGGTTNINALLAADLKLRTTYPPLLLSNLFLTNSVTLWPHATRDIDIPDVGYHYDPLDHVYHRVFVQNATLTVNPGVVLGSFSAGFNYGFALGTNCLVWAEGTASAPVRFVRYACSQEQATSTWTDGASPIMCYLWYDVPLGEATFNFTEWVTLGGAGFPINTSGQNTNGVLPLVHSQIFGGTISVIGRSLLLTNNLLERCYWWTEDLSLPHNFRNNTFWRGSIDTSWSAGTNCSFVNNVFDQTQLSSTGLEIHNYNGYQSGYPRFTVGGGNGANDVISAAPIAYSAGNFGSYYQTATNFFNRGSFSATNFGLYHFTVQTSNVKETNSVVDLGFHYVAANTNGAPFDLDQDGTPDHSEDRNGDGIVNGTENSWTNYNSLNGLSGPADLRIFTPLK